MGIIEEVGADEKVAILFQTLLHSFAEPCSADFSCCCLHPPSLPSAGKVQPVAIFCAHKPTQPPFLLLPPVFLRPPPHPTNPPDAAVIHPLAARPVTHAAYSLAPMGPTVQHNPLVLLYQSVPV